MPRSLCSTQAASGRGFTSSAGMSFTWVIRPRSVEHGLHHRPRRLLGEEGAEFGLLAVRHVDEEKLGAFSRTGPFSSRLRLASTSRGCPPAATGPAPASTTEGVSAPGRWMLPRARRAAAPRGGAPAGQGREAGGDQPQQHEHGGSGGEEDRGGLFVVGGEKGEHHQRRPEAADEQQVGQGNAPPHLADAIPEQRRNPRLLRPRQRDHRKHGGNHQPVERRPRQRRSIELRIEGNGTSAPMAAVAAKGSAAPRIRPSTIPKAEMGRSPRHRSGTRRAGSRPALSGWR